MPDRPSDTTLQSAYHSSTSDVILPVVTMALLLMVLVPLF